MCPDRNANPHYADQKHQSLSPVFLSARLRHAINSSLESPFFFPPLLQQWSFTLFRGLIWIFFWLVVIYSIAVLVLIYTYQFEDFPGYWTNGTGISQDVFIDLGLRQYDTSDLFLNLLIPTCFIIIIMVYIHYFHSKFMDITKIQQSGYK